MPSKAAQDRITGLQSQLSEAQRMAKLYSMPYMDGNNAPVESAQQAGKDKAGKPIGNPDYLPSSASMYLQEAGRVQTALTAAQQAGEAEGQPATTVHPTSNGGLVAVTTSKNPDDVSNKVTSTEIVPADSHQIVNIPGVGVGTVDKNGQFQMVWNNQNLTPSEKVAAAYQGYGAYATWLNSQTSAGQLDETKRKNLWDAAHQQYADQLDAVKVQQAQQTNDEKSRQNQATYDTQNTTTAASFADSQVKNEISSFPYRAGPDLGADFAGNFARIAANPSGGQSNMQFKPGDFNFQAPDPVALGQQQFAQMMARISPYAKIQATNGALGPLPSAPQLPSPGSATAPTGGPQSVNLMPGTTPDVIDGVSYGSVQP